MSSSFLRASVLLALVAGCGGSQQSAFSHQFRDNQDEDFAAVLERLPQPASHESPQNTLHRPLAVATTNDEPRRVVAMDPSTGETLWAHEIDAQTRPEILGDLVITSDRTQLVALDLSSGNVRWTSRLGDLAYVGAKPRTMSSICSRFSLSAVLTCCQATTKMASNNAHVK